MARHYFLGLLVLLSCSLLEALPRPTLNDASTQYLPFYGGAKGQYLEIKKDTVGSITSEKIVSEDKIGNDNIFKNSEDSLLSKVLAANLQSLRSISNNILKLHSLGRKTGRLGNAEKNRFKTQLAALGDAASNTIKLVEEIGDNVDNLYKKNATTVRKYGGLDSEGENDDVGEEGVGVDADGSTANGDFMDEDKTIVAEAKPIGNLINYFSYSDAIKGRNNRNNLMITEPSGRGYTTFLGIYDQIS